MFSLIDSIAFLFPIQNIRAAFGFVFKLRASGFLLTINKSINIYVYGAARPPVRPSVGH